MKNSIKKILTLSLSILCLFFLISTGNAYGTTYTNNIVIEGNASGLVTIPDVEDFLVKDNFLPGDSAEGTIKLTNNYDYPYEVFIRAYDIENKSDEDLAKQLHLKLDKDEKGVYSGELQGGDTMEKEISLGVIKPGETKVVSAKVTLDGETTGNIFKNKYASIQWIFTAERVVEEAPIKKTADKKDVIIWGAVTLAVAFAGLTIISRRRGYRESK